MINDDAKWWKLLHDLFQTFKYQNIMTEDIDAFFNEQTGPEPDADFQPVPAPRGRPPVLELKFDAAGGSVDYRWQADEKAFRDADPRRQG